ncbi:sulfotransferase family 2 domain-containing protein [Microcystis aeruginosa]|uniref:sulfotransferase family 2 domain-containing protein n=1 Tax=Microcystis aeruginosa TaxID=1126 RepID=UPI0002E60902|nr:sulfotransferase family 2 domain-containing protein [Microcystis aeruginosa]
MLISREYKFIFVHIYKNAGTSITTVLRPFAISPWQWKAYRLIKKAGFPSPFFDPHPFPAHVKASEIKESLGAEKFNEYFSFAVVRNPWDWQVSHYKYALKSETHHQHELTKNLGSFEEYIKWRCENEVRYQKDFIYENNELLVDFVGRYESLDNDFNEICSRIGISVSLPKLNVSNTKPYQSYYSEKSKELVKEAFEPDIRTFNYEF